MKCEEKKQILWHPLLIKMFQDQKTVPNADRRGAMEPATLHGQFFFVTVSQKPKDKQKEKNKRQAKRKKQKINKKKKTKDKQKEKNKRQTKRKNKRHTT